MRERARVPVNLSETARQLASHRQLWGRLVDFDPVSRHYARIAPGPDHEAWLLTWLPGQGADWHDHGGSAGSFVVLQGQLTEQVGATRPARDGWPTTTLAAGDQRTFGRHHVHRVTNVGLDPAVSLHVYSPKLTVMTTYVVSDGRLRPSEQQQVGVNW
ncbi:MAG: cysteine dioxygenase [Dermatophilaceae bacterium]